MTTVALDLQRSFYEMLIGSQYWDATRVNDYQKTQLEQLLRHCRRSVPFYETRLNVAFNAFGGIDWRRWQDIPILRRDDLLDHRDAMLARELPEGHGPTYEDTTSGSTGPAVTTTHSSRASQAARAALFRSHRWHDLDWSANLGAWFGDNPEEARWPLGVTGKPWGPHWDPEAQKGRFVRVNRYASAADALEFFERRQARYFTGRGKTSQTLALEALRGGRGPKFEAMLGFATGNTDDERDDCQRAFGAKMTSYYSSKEGLGMAYQCPTGTHYHVNDECVLLEIVREDGSPCRPGEQGRVVITPLYSTAQPLIRYDQGDLAVAGARCQCGRHLTTIERIVGRTMHLFRFPDGTVLAPIIPSYCLALLGAKYWQIAQVGPLEIEVRYVPATPGVIGDEAQVASVIRQRTHADAAVTFVERDEIARAHGGKYLVYVNENPDQPAG